MYVYDPERHEFSRKMSGVAYRKIYVPVLRAVSLERMDSDSGGPTDPDLRGTDVVLILRSGRRVTVAERFRKHLYLGYNDVTLRYCSLATGRKLEVVGLNAQYMLYAVANMNETDFLRWDLIYGPKLLEILETLKPKPISNVNGSSRFVAVPRGVLFNAGAVAASSHPQIRVS